MAISDCTLDKPATIYVLADSRIPDPVLRIRYVGRTITSLERRMKAHWQTAKSGDRTARACWMRAVLSAGGDILIEPVALTTMSACAEAEQQEITRHRTMGCDLLNHTDGGDGVLNPTAETRARIGAAKRGHKFWVGKTHTTEARAKIAASRRGKKMLPHVAAALSTEAVRQKIAATLRSKVYTPEELATRRQHALRYFHSPEGRQRAAEVRQTPEAQARRRATAQMPHVRAQCAENGRKNRGRKHSPDAVARMAAAQRGRTHTEATKAKMRAWQQADKSHRAKLTWAQVNDIRAAHAGGESQHSIARRYSVAPKTVNLIVHHKTWQSGEVAA
jgi:hypothetical protein